MDGETIRNNLKSVYRRIDQAARSVGKTADDITLVAVTKTFDVPTMMQAIEAGVKHIGENRIQEARQKLPALPEGLVTRHLIGHLQRNKVKYAVKLFDVIQSVDNITIAEELNARCSKINHIMPILIQVNTSNEPQKFGCDPQSAITLLKAIDRLPNLSTRGFMTIALYSDDPEDVRPCFKLLREIYEEARQIPLNHAKIETLSMGMSSDFEIAIAEGANMVRIGSAIFGERPPTE
jgi:hypothetical protein